MAFITGIFLIDAKAAALNNGRSQNNVGKVKSIYVPGQGYYPYVSAQSFRYWLRTSLEELGKDNDKWSQSPINVGKGSKQQAYSASNPVTYWDDDLLGYAKLVGGKDSATRISPFRTSTLTSVAPATIVKDFGVMARGPKTSDKEGVLLHEHEFYRATLIGMFSLDLYAAGTFVQQKRPGFQNLDSEVLEIAKERCAEHFKAQDRNGEEYDVFRLSLEERIERVQFLLRGLARIEGGAKQTLHYSDVSPSFVMAAVTAGGNNMFRHIVQTSDNYPVISKPAMEQAHRVFGSELLSTYYYIGRAEGFMDNSRGLLDGFVKHAYSDDEMTVVIPHPRETLDMLADDLAANPKWMD